ncbi:carbohydrate sulfotransferase 11-like [Macrobrachium nipponense]|uniref:carbohydrate sulfotransferase 11-like n=1 Tax=Macrobrachium nipponense TaxID=159736 RepID=UPI0030C7A795
MARSSKFVILVVFFATTEFLTIFYYEHDRLYSFDKINSNQTQLAGGNTTQTLERIEKEIHEEEDAIYGSRPSAPTATKETLPGPPDDAALKKVEDRFRSRKEHLEKACDKFRPVHSSPVHHRKTDQFLINRHYGLIWCNIFKAASSSWLWNFNLLAGYTEKQLIEKSDQPLTLARKKYPRPAPTTVDATRRGEPPPLTFIIVRHPFARLVSAFRDKILKGSSFYRPLAKAMMMKHRELYEQHPDDWHDFLKVKSLDMPTFAQFVQYIIDERKHRRPLNEHWVPMNDYCTPCPNHFDIIAKVETLDEDGNYIIYKSGVQDIVRPRVLNKAEGRSSDKLTEYFICQLTEPQLMKLIEVYKYDLEIFDYDVQKYLDCVRTGKPSRKPR